MTDSYESKYAGIHHVYLQLSINELPVLNSVANVVIDSNMRVVSVAHSLPDSEMAKSMVSQFSGGKPVYVDARQAFDAAVSYLGLDLVHASGIQMQESEKDSFTFTQVPGANGDVEVKKRFVLVPKADKVQLTMIWSVLIDLDTNWFDMQVDASSGQIVSLLDYVNHASFNVYPLGINDPESGKRSIVVNPEHPVASLVGWNTQIVEDKNESTTITVFKTTIGNNVYAQENLSGKSKWRNNYRPNGGNNRVFDFPIDFSKQPISYLDAAITQLFYVCNSLHDLLYVYGFDEVAGNFQDENFHRGGKGRDAVIANAADGSGYNNANFATPPDGRQPRMRMYYWTESQPKRDGDLESGIIIHEYSHGLSIRLTGGPSNVACLGWGESGGMGEGYGDTIATFLRTTANDTRKTDFAMGAYSANDPEGLRRYVYSTSLETNPSTYGFLKKPNYREVHAKGEVFAAILYEVFWNLVDKHNFNANWLYPGDKKFGNQLALQLLLDGMKLQPCYPTFVEARDAILLADQLKTKGENQCIMWSAFAKRGLGVNATAGGNEDFNVPDEC